MIINPLLIEVNTWIFKKNHLLGVNIIDDAGNLSRFLITHPNLRHILRMSYSYYYIKSLISKPGNVKGRFQLILCSYHSRLETFFSGCDLYDDICFALCYVYLQVWQTSCWPNLMIWSCDILSGAHVYNFKFICDILFANGSMY